jgi:hypothetical protein
MMSSGLQVTPQLHDLQSAWLTRRFRTEHAILAIVATDRTELQSTCGNAKISSWTLKTVGLAITSPSEQRRTGILRRILTASALSLMRLRGRG